MGELGKVMSNLYSKVAETLENEAISALIAFLALVTIYSVVA